MRLESGESGDGESARKLISNKLKTNNKKIQPKRKNDKTVNKYLH